MRRAPYVLSATVVSVVALLSFRTHSLTASTTTTSAASGVVSKRASGSHGSTTTTTAPNTSKSTSTSSTGTASGTATGTAEDTRYGVVQVRVTVAAGRITDVTAVAVTAFDAHSQQINSEAVPELRSEVLQAQSAQIDGVSGATFTSDGYEASLQSALDKLGYTG